MACIPERLVMKSGLWWHAYHISYAEKIVTLVIHEPSWWSSAQQAQLGLLDEMREIKIKHIFQNPIVYEDQKEKENWFKQRLKIENVVTS